MVALLLDRRADVHAQDRWGGTPVTDAAAQASGGGDKRSRPGGRPMTQKTCETCFYTAVYTGTSAPDRGHS